MPAWSPDSDDGAEGIIWDAYPDMRRLQPKVRILRHFLAYPIGAEPCWDTAP